MDYKVGERIRELREGHCYTREWFSEIVDISSKCHPVVWGVTKFEIVLTLWVLDTAIRVDIKKIAGKIKMEMLVETEKSNKKADSGNRTRLSSLGS